MKKKAFTLIELLVVISIIALLMAILMPALGKAREQAKKVVCMSNMRGAITAVSAYRADNQDYPVHASAVARPNLLGRQKSYNISGKHDDTYVYKYLAGYVDDVATFNCPVSGFKRDTYHDTVGSVDYTFQDSYRNKDGIWDTTSNGLELTCSYALYWNYEVYSKNTGGFVGPGKRSKTKLLISDYFGYYNNLAPTQSWVSTHKLKGSSIARETGNPPYNATADSSPGQYTEVDRDGYTVIKSNTMFDKLDLNVGFVDGSVSKIKGSETVKQTAVGDSWSYQFMPNERYWK